VFAGARETVVGEARYVRDRDPSIAEFAVAVAEDWQGQGLASLLLGKLVSRAAGAGIERMVGETLASNQKMLHLARKAGFTATPSADMRGLVLLERVIGSNLQAVGRDEATDGPPLSAYAGPEKSPPC
jgi:RimJ/RimL family protein N-acetyltransferase